jgi:signal recognition particle GTPase
MKTLFEQMIPEVKELFLADKEKYPNRHEIIMKDLETIFFVSDLSVNLAITLVEYFKETEVKPKYNSFISKLYAVFGQ